MPIINGNIEIYMGPQQLGGPDDLQDAIIKFIDGANKKLFIAVQELDSQPIAEAIVRAKKRKVLVKLVIEADYLLEKTALINPFLAGGEFETNRVLHDAILRASIDTHSDFNPGIFHQKFMVRDSKSILTGSANFTVTDTTKNLNHIIIVHDKDVTKNFIREYEEIQQGHFGKLNEGHDPKPEEVMVSGVRIKILFAPDHNPEMEIMKQIAKAKRRVDFAIFTFALSSGIDDQLVQALDAGISIRGALYASQANQKWSASETLRNAGLPLFFIPRPGLTGIKPRKLHHKLMVIDEQLIIAGSFNYTGPANQLNDENIIILGDLDTPITEDDAISKQRSLAQYALAEIDRIITSFG